MTHDIPTQADLGRWHVLQAVGAQVARAAADLSLAGFVLISLGRPARGREYARRALGLLDLACAELRRTLADDYPPEVDHGAG